MYNAVLTTLWEKVRSIFDFNSEPKFSSVDLIYLKIFLCKRRGNAVLATVPEISGQWRKYFDSIRNLIKEFEFSHKNKDSENVPVETKSALLTIVLENVAKIIKFLLNVEIQILGCFFCRNKFPQKLLRINQ